MAAGRRSARTPHDACATADCRRANHAEAGKALVAAAFPARVIERPDAGGYGGPAHRQGPSRRGRIEGIEG